MNSLQKARLKNNGYLKIQSCIDKDILSAAQKAFNRWRHELLNGNRQLNTYESIGICHYCHAYNNSEFMLSLYEIAYGYAQILLGENNVVEFGRAMVGWPPAFKESNKRQQWHVDNVDLVVESKNPRVFPKFQLVIGFPLTDIVDECSGGLVVWPGQHRYVSSIFKSNDDIKEALIEIQRLMYSSHPPGTLKHLYEKRGDVILFNSLLPHGTAINESPYFADKVYFRFCHADPAIRSSIFSSREPWGKWQGI